MTHIETILDPFNVLVDVRAADKTRLLADLAERAAAAVDLDAKTIASSVMAREALGSTGLGDGIGLPHARLEGLGRPFAAMARLKKPIEFDAVDGQPVDLVIFLLLPLATANDNLTTLASIARRLREPGRLKRLRQASDSSKMLAALLD